MKSGHLSNLNSAPSFPMPQTDLSIHAPALAPSEHRSVWIAQSGEKTRAGTTDATANSGGPLEADVCIIGAGIAGLTTAYQLAYGGKKVIVLEVGRGVAEGESSRTTAQLATELDDRYFEIERLHG